MDLRVIYVYDDEADAWGFRIPNLGISSTRPYPVARGPASRPNHARRCPCGGATSRVRPRGAAPASRPASARSRAAADRARAAPARWGATMAAPQAARACRAQTSPGASAARAAPGREAAPAAPRRRSWFRLSPSEAGPSAPRAVLRRARIGLTERKGPLVGGHHGVGHGRTQAALLQLVEGRGGGAPR